MRIFISHLKRAGLLLCVYLTLSTSGCSPSKAKKIAENGVGKFHSQLDAGQYHDIYSHASDGFQKSGTEAEITEFLAAVHRKLGHVKSANEQSFFVNFGTAATMVTVKYRTEFDAGPANEEFVWSVGDEPILVNYRIDSRALITK